ncbi:MAG: hypothetical protein H0W83_00410 [Planctomycetes bacterium]|nr:hypothetical protein [Planctomycetota bacterium]
MTSDLLVRGAATIIGLLLAAAHAGAEDVGVYTATIKPLLALRCYSCHGESKQKGGLRLDSPEWIAKGGKNGAVLVPGKPDDSPLYARTILPKDDADIMPAKGEPLTKAQTDSIAQWIRDGGVMEADKPAPSVASAPAAVHPTPDGKSAAAPAPGAPAAPLVNVFDAASTGIKPPDAAVVKSLGELGIVVAALSTNGALLDVTVSHSHGETVDKLRLLERIAVNIAWLDLRGTTITDAQMKSVAKMANLSRLHLEKTGIGDAGVALLAACPKLEYLNLFATKVTDAGLQHLEGLAALKHVYLWQSAATPAGIARLQKAIPGLEVVSGP